MSEPDARPTISGAVLAGGGSRRMGRDKRWLEVDGVPLLVRALIAVAEVADDTHVVTSSSRDADASSARLPDTDAAWLVDHRPGQGPLAGIEAALTGATHDIVVVVAGDQPFVEPDVLRLLVSRLEAEPVAQAAAAVTGLGPQPVLAAYRRSALDTVRLLLDGGERRARTLLDELDHVVMVPADDWHEVDVGGRSAIDLDTPEEAAAQGATSPAGAGPDGRDDRAGPDGREDPGGPDGRDDRAGPDGREDPAGPTADGADVAHGRRAATVRIIVGGPDGGPRQDEVTVEEPLGIRACGPFQRPITVVTTMRTPGHDADLAVGWLYTEGLVQPDGVADIRAGDAAELARPDDQITVRLTHPLELEAAKHRHTAATASCGVCGRASIDELAARVVPIPSDVPGVAVAWSTLVALPDLVREHQRVFATTGGLHATALATADGEVEVLREDVGRHNALDAAIGASVRAGGVPLHHHLAVLSGRIGFELVAKAAAAGIPLVAAVGAPTDLAVRTAERLGITLVGFLRAGVGNIYTHGHRIDLDA